MVDKRLFYEVRAERSRKVESATVTVIDAVDEV